MRTLQTGLRCCVGGPNTAATTIGIGKRIGGNEHDSRHMLPTCSARYKFLVLSLQESTLLESWYYAMRLI